MTHLKSSSLQTGKIWKTLMFFSLVLCLVSCSSKIEKKVNEYQQQEKTILSSTLGTEDPNEYILFMDKEGIFLDDMEKTTKLVSFGTEYIFKEMYARINRNKLGAVVRESNNFNSLTGAKLTLKQDDIYDNSIAVITDWCLILYSNLDKGVYIFMPNSNNIYYAKEVYCHDTKYYYSNEDGAPVYAERDRFKKEDEITILLHGDLIYSDAHEPQDGENPLKKLLPDFIYDWCTNIDCPDCADASIFDAYYNLTKGNLFDGSIDKIEFKKMGWAGKFEGKEIGTQTMWTKVAENIGSLYNIWKEDINELMRRDEEVAAQERVRAIVDQSVSFMKFLDLYLTNEIKAVKTYPTGKTMIFGIELERIESGYSSYKLVPDAYIKTNVNMSTDDEAFTELNYPCYVYIQTDFVECTKGWDGQLYFKFQNTVLKAWDKSNR
ncbi:MAG: hypothetical protein IJV61_06370 [Paludibacteraceae bacterium]|nr:hypothetical protein [Paludibacteraceae bacterium]